MSRLADIKLKLNWLILIGILLIILSIVFVTFYIDDIKAQQDVVVYNAYSTSYQSLVKQDRVSLVRILKPFCMVGIDDGGMFVNGRTYAFDVEVTLIDQRYFEIYTPELLYGRSLSTKDLDRGGAIISDELAFQLFREVNCIGKQFEYMGSSYYVAGVTEEIQSSVSRGSYTAILPGTDCMPTDYFSLIGVPRLNASTTEVNLVNLFRGRSTLTRVYTIEDEKHEAYFMMKLLMLIPLILVLIAAVGYINRFASRRFDDIKAMLKQAYFGKVFLKVILYMLVVAAMYGGVVLVIVLTYRTLVADIVVIDQYVPSPLIDMDEIQKIITMIQNNTNNPYPYIPLEARIVARSIRMVVAGLVGAFAGGVLMVGGIVKSVLKADKV